MQECLGHYTQLILSTPPLKMSYYGSKENRAEEQPREVRRTYEPTADKQVPFMAELDAKIQRQPTSVITHPALHSKQI